MHLLKAMLPCMLLLKPGVKTLLYPKRFAVMSYTCLWALCRRLSEAERGGSPRQKGPRGATWLPSRYRLQRVHVQRQAGLRWADEFDFSFYNRTRFAGLENGVANCYVNSLVQASVPCTAYTAYAPHTGLGVTGAYGQNRRQRVLACLMWALVHANRAPVSCSAVPSMKTPEGHYL